MLNLKQLDILSQYIRSLPEPVQFRILDKMEELIEECGYITVGDLKELVRSQLS